MGLFAGAGHVAQGGPRREPRALATPATGETTTIILMKKSGGPGGGATRTTRSQHQHHQGGLLEDSDDEPHDHHDYDHHHHHHHEASVAASLPTNHLSPLRAKEDDDASLGSLCGDEDMYRQFLAYFGEGGEDWLFPDEQDDTDDEEYDPDEDPYGGDDNDKELSKVKVSQQELVRLLEEAKEHRRLSRQHGMSSGKARAGSRNDGGGGRPESQAMMARPIAPGVRFPGRSDGEPYDSPLQARGQGGGFDRVSPAVSQHRRTTHEAGTKPPPPPRPPPPSPAGQIMSFLTDEVRARIARQVAQHYQLCLQTLFRGVAAAPPGGIAPPEILAAMTDTHDLLLQLRRQRDQSDAFLKEVLQDGTVRVRGGEDEEGIRRKGRWLRRRDAEPRLWGHSCCMFDVPRLDAVEDIITLLRQRNRSSRRDSGPAVTTSAARGSAQGTVEGEPIVTSTTSATTTITTSTSTQSTSAPAPALSPLARGDASQSGSAADTTNGGSEPKPSSGEEESEDPRASVDDSVREILKDGTLYEELLVGSEAKVQALVRHCDKISEKPQWVGREPQGIFTPGEERLLARGLRVHGDKAFNLIEASYLPIKKADAMETHYYNRQLNFVPSNVLKEYRIEQERKRLFSMEEDKLLLQGIKEFGNRWISIVEKYLPHRDRQELRYRYVKCIKKVVEGKETLEQVHERENAKDATRVGIPRRRRRRTTKAQKPPVVSPPQPDDYGDDYPDYPYQDYGDDDSDYEREELPSSGESDDDDDDDEEEGDGRGGRPYYEAPQPQVFPSRAWGPRAGGGGAAAAGRPAPSVPSNPPRDDDYDSRDEYEQEDLDSDDSSDDEEIIMDDDDDEDSAAGFEKENISDDSSDSSDDDDDREEEEEWQQQPQQDQRHTPGRQHPSMASSHPPSAWVDHRHHHHQEQEQYHRPEAASSSSNYRGHHDRMAWHSGGESSSEWSRRGGMWHQDGSSGRMMGGSSSGGYSSPMRAQQQHRSPSHRSHYTDDDQYRVHPRVPAPLRTPEPPPSKRGRR